MTDPARRNQPHRSAERERAESEAAPTLPAPLLRRFYSAGEGEDASAELMFALALAARFLDAVMLSGAAAQDLGLNVRAMVTLGLMEVPEKPLLHARLMIDLPGADPDVVQACSRTAPETFQSARTLPGQLVVQLTVTAPAPLEDADRAICCRAQTRWPPDAP